MLQNWLILLPEIIFAAFLLTAALVNRYRESKTPKTFFTLSKFFLLAILLSTVVFYNKSAFPDWWENSSYTTLFKVVIYLTALTWFYLSSRWFLNRGHPSFRFYSLAMFNLLLFELLLSARNLLLPALIVPLLCVLNWRYYRLGRDGEENQLGGRIYAVFATVFVLMLLGGTVLLWLQSSSFEYKGIYQYLLTHQPDSQICAAVAMIMLSWLFMTALAPFHLWYISLIKNAALPVSGFLTLLPPFVYLACLINLMTTVFSPLQEVVKPLLLCFAAVSLLLGALSANGEKNLRGLFAYSSIYNLGFILFSILSFADNAVLSAFSYTIIYVLAMAGIYTVFLGLKSRGEYLVALEEINGLSGAKPYMSAALLIFMFSMIGIPPLLGFLGRLSVINTLVIEERWGQVVILLAALMFMANAYLRVIRSIYFEAPRSSFDRTDKAIYICLAVNLILVIISILNPGSLINDAEKILSGGF